MSWVDRVRGRVERLVNPVPWTRFFLTRASVDALTREGWTWGDASAGAQSLMRRLEDFDDVECLVIVGEPGAGKSVTLWMDALARHDQGSLVWGYDLIDCQSEGLVSREITNNVDFDRVIAASGSRHVYLDGFDESSAVSVMLPSELERVLSGGHPPGLHLRVTSRLTPNFDALIQRLALVATTDVVFIAPLQSDDVRLAAQVRGIDPVAFVDAVERRGAQGLTTKPLAVNLLISDYAASGDITSSQQELYERQIRMLCREQRQTIMPDPRRADVDDESRLAIAARIAALTAIGNRPIITVDPQTEAHGRTIGLSDLSRGTEPIGETWVDVTPQTLKDTLSSGLFVAWSVKSASWTHQTYRDYLAARWLHAHRVTPKQALSLLITGDPPRLVPQLYPLASWVALELPGFLELLVGVEPEVVLFGEAIDAAMRNPAACVSALLQPEAAHRVIDWRPVPLANYGRLEHERLGNQLREILLARGRDADVVVLASLIARACHVHDASEGLLPHALDAEAPDRVRGAALAALRDVAPLAIRQSLVPLASNVTDPQLLGLVFQATWPDAVSADELFKLLPTTLAAPGVNALTMFLHYDLTPGLEESDLSAALDWCSKVEGPHHLDLATVEAINGITREAVRYLDNTDIRARLFVLLEERWGSGWPRETPVDLGAALGGNEEARRQLLALIVSSSTPISLAMGILQLGPGVASLNDVEWLVDLAVAAGDDDKAAAIGLVIRYVALWSGDIDRALAVRGRVPAIDRQLDALNDATEPQEREPEQSQEAPLSALAEAVRRILELVGITAEQRWLAIADTFMQSSGSAIPGGVPRTPLWAGLLESERLAVIGHAADYLNEVMPPEDWFTSAAIPSEALYGDCALQLLVDTDVGHLDTLPSPTRCRWLPTALASFSNDPQEAAALRLLVARLKELEPRDFLTSLRAVLLAEARRFSNVVLLPRLDGIWDGDLAAVIAACAASSAVPPTAVATLLSAVIERGFSTGDDVARRLLDARAADAESRSRAVAAAAALLGRPDGGWPLLWPILVADHDFGRAVLQTASSTGLERFDLGLSARLTERQLGDLHEWMHIAYTTEEINTTPHSGFRPPFEPDRFHAALINALVYRGTEEGCRVLCELRDAHPEEQWLARALEAAHDVRRRVSWEGVSPATVRLLAFRDDCRLVRSGGELREVVIDALHVIGQRLRAEGSLVRLLWNEERQKPRKLLFPKDEESLSDFLKVMLEIEIRERGVVIGREVQIRRGERTDLHIDAAAETKTPGLLDVVSVTVEVKGCWNPEMRSAAMATQLVGRYLSETQCRDGIYLVGWFQCDEWGDDDWRKAACRGATVSELAAELQVQAAALTTSDVHVASLVLDLSWR